MSKAAEAEAEDPVQSSNPFVNLARSRKFILAIFAIASWVAGMFKYDLDPTLTMGAITGVISILIYSIAKEDAAAKHASMAADAELERAETKKASTDAMIGALPSILIPILDGMKTSSNVDVVPFYAHPGMTDEELTEYEAEFKHNLESIATARKNRETFAAANPGKPPTDTEH